MPVETDSRPRADGGSDSGDSDDSPVTPQAIVDSIRAAPVPVVNTQYLAGQYSTSVEEMHEQLSAMVEDGTLEHLYVEERWHLWWLSLEDELTE
ncbi:hypothetical protein [Natronosalvus rutilus]|uniref:Uncharacterized protein n=1 Tax=Natronosalvus rutilus TaxID=2953753 RepID=A0A9E7NBQ8_9EURY|nr:hypothetical protein [Natronosalvus rutilus]UTF54456.1 hypothetical protein NGM29_04030 [Natronosalvus rutilus]